VPGCHIHISPPIGSHPISVYAVPRPPNVTVSATAAPRPRVGCGALPASQATFISRTSSLAQQRTGSRAYSLSLGATEAVDNSRRGINEPGQQEQEAEIKMYTSSFAFFEAIWDAGVTHCFVNLGSDHPSIIEAMVKGQREKKGKFPRIITCPNEVRTSRASGPASSKTHAYWLDGCHVNGGWLRSPHGKASMCHCSRRCRYARTRRGCSQRVHGPSTRPGICGYVAIYTRGGDDR